MRKKQSVKKKGYIDGNQANMHTVGAYLPHIPRLAIPIDDNAIDWPNENCIPATVRLICENTTGNVVLTKCDKYSILIFSSVSKLSHDINEYLKCNGWTIKHGCVNAYEKLLAPSDDHAAAVSARDLLARLNSRSGLDR